MKKLSNFSVFFILFITLLAAILLIYLDILGIVDYSKSANEIEKSSNLILILKYTGATIGVLVGGFALSSILYQLIRIAKNVESQTITNTYSNTSDKFDYTNLSKTAKQIIKHLTIKDKNNLKEKYTKWSNEIGSFPLHRLYEIINEEQCLWEKEYIYLCCFEILTKIKNNN